MPRKIVPPSNEYPYHIVARCRNREWFPLPRAEVWGIMEDYNFFISHAYGIEILAFVLMDNHFHMIVRDPAIQLSPAMNYFMKNTSLQMSSGAGMINQIWGGRFNKSLINDPLYFLHAYKYVLRNPVEAGLCDKVEEYDHSTLRMSLGLSRMTFPVYPDQTLFESPDQTLKWLNTTPEAPDKEMVRKALQKTVFKIPTTKKTERPHKLSSTLY